MKPMMKCGHSANATINGIPGCGICAGLRSGATEIAEAPDLTGRVARCNCGTTRPSSTNLAFYKYLPEKEQDDFYCGCYGWD